MGTLEKLKGKFTQRWLSRSDEFYSPIFARLFYAQFHYLDRKGYTSPPDFLTAVINAEKEGKELDEVEDLAEAVAPIAESLKAKGEAFSRFKIREELKDSQCDYNETYCNYRGFVHPSSTQSEFRVNQYYSYKEGRNVITKAEIKRLCADMIKINRKIARLLKCQIFAYNAGLKD